MARKIDNNHKDFYMLKSSMLIVLNLISQQIIIKLININDFK